MPESIRLPAMEPGSPEWHAARRWRIGGSEIGAVMGWSQFQSRDDILSAKLTGEHQPQSAAMLRGTILEPALLAWGAAKHGYVYDTDAAACTYLHPLHDWALYNPDGITADGLLIEAKTTSDRSKERGWGRAGTDQVPLSYRAQCQWGMGILALPEARLICLSGGLNGRPSLAFAEYRIPRDPDMFRRLLGAGARFIHDLRTATTAVAA